MPTTFSVVELVWMALGLIGMMFAVVNVHDAWLDRRAVKVSVMDMRREKLLKMATAGVRQDALRFIQCATIAGIGLFAGLEKPPISDAQRRALHIPTWTPVTVMLTAALFLIVFIILVQMFLDWRLRKAFYGRRKADGGPVQHKRSTETVGGP